MSGITASPVTSLDLSKLDRIRRFAGPTALAVGPVLMVSGMALHEQWAGSGNEEPDERYIRAVEGNLTQWVTSHFLATVGLALLAGGATTIFRLARGRGTVLTVVGATAVVLGAALIALSDLLNGFLAYALAGHVDATTSLAIQEAYFSLLANAVLNSGSTLLPVGFVVLAVALLRSRAVPRWAAIVLLLGPVGIMLGFEYQNQYLKLVLGLPLVVGLAVLARAIARR